MDTREFRLKIAEVTVTAIGVFGALGAGAVAYWDYSDKANLEALRALHTAQLQACEKVAEQSAQLYAAENQTEFDRALNQFAKTKHGQALAVLSAPVLDEMKILYNKASHFSSSNTGNEFKRDIVSFLCNDPFKVVEQCRVMLSSFFQRAGSDDLPPMDSQYFMQWSNDDCKPATPGGPPPP